MRSRPYPQTSTYSSISPPHTSRQNSSIFKAQSIHIYDIYKLFYYIRSHAFLLFREHQIFHSNRLPDSKCAHKCLPFLKMSEKR